MEEQQVYMSDHGLRLASGRVVEPSPWLYFFWMDNIGRNGGVATYDWVSGAMSKKEIGGVHICDGSAPGRVGNVEDSKEFIPIRQIESVLHFPKKEVV